LHVIEFRVLETSSRHRLGDRTGWEALVQVAMRMSEVRIFEWMSPLTRHEYVG